MRMTAAVRVRWGTIARPISASAAPETCTLGMPGSPRPRQVIQAGPGGREVDPQGGVRLPLGQGDLAGQQQFAAADGGLSRMYPVASFGHAQARWHSLEVVHGVAAPVRCTRRGAVIASAGGF